MMNIVEVVAALIWNGEKFMICQRPVTKKRGLLWEFVGGKVEKGESKERALIRECKEELDIEIEVDSEFISTKHTYPDITINLTVFNSRIVSGKPTLLEHKDLKWITENEIPNYHGFPVFCGESAIEDFAQLNWVDEALFSIPTELVFPDKLIGNFGIMGITVHIKLARVVDDSSNQIVEKLEGYTVLSTSINMVSTGQLIFKRTMDICGGLVGMLLTGIIFIFVAPIIYIKSPGPIFFKQVRIGKNGKKFNIYKFRSMYMDAEERKKELMAQNDIKDGMMFKMDNDPRIIKGIGNFIRDYSLDEFPQFWNVLKGDMSLVGTRPPTVDEWEKYEMHHRSRLAFKPGLTGMWQVSGRSNITDFEEVVRLDTEYIKKWSPGLDIKILFKTVAVVLGKVGSK